MIPQELIDRILDRLDIAEIISGYIQLKKAGRNFKACCPFHNEKTASFVVSPDKQIYHCFGCSAGGNAIGFVMKYENMDFPEAIQMLADRVGVELPKYKRDDGGKPSEAARLYEINKIAVGFYQNSLKGEKGKRALEYLKKRGFTSDTINEFGIGYAPGEWESLKKYCNTKKVSDVLLKKAGLTISSEKGRGDYDRFRNRIIFPIFNERGNIIAFGGRVMDDSLPKYINSPETEIYSKSNVLYGLNFSRRGIREKGCAVIVEGYMDVVMPFQHGIRNAVATSGTALTSPQAAMLKKYTDTAVMVFDADQAGESASLRGLDILIEKGMKVRIATLPKGEDPDSFVKKNGQKAFEDIAASAKDLFDYKLDILVGKLGARDVGGIADEMLPTISKVESAVVRSDYLRRLAERLRVHESSLRHEMSKVKPDYSYHHEPEVKTDKKVFACKKSEAHLLGLAIIDKAMFIKVRDELGLDKFHDTNVRKILGIIEELFNKGEKSINPGKLLSRLENDPDAKTVAIQALAKSEITEDRVKALSDCMSYLKKENREEELKELTTDLKSAEATGDDAQMRKILKRINTIHKEKVA